MTGQINLAASLALDIFVRLRNYRRLRAYFVEDAHIAQYDKDRRLQNASLSLIFHTLITVLIMASSIAAVNVPPGVVSQIHV